MAFFDDAQSPMTLESALRYLRCSCCGSAKKLSFEQLAAVMESRHERDYRCPNCEEKACSLERKLSS